MKTEKKLETTERILTVKLPKKFDSYLQSLAKALNRSVESLLLEQLYSVLETFFQGGFAQSWTDLILEVQEESGKNLEEQVSEVANTVLNQHHKQPLSIL
jgi:hypothetical protein